MNPGVRPLAIATVLSLLLPHFADAGARKRRAPGPTAVRSARRSVPRRPPGPPALVVPASASARDLAVSEAARFGLGAQQGAVVVMDPYTGRVLTVLNPYLGLSTAYEPCSVFKIVVAVAGLTEHVVTPDTVYNCAGGCPDDATLQKLKSFATSFPPSPICHLRAGVIGPVITRFDDMKTKYAAIVWDRVLLLDAPDTDQILAFFQTEGERANPEKQCAAPSPGTEPSTAPSGSAGASPAPSGSAGASPAPSGSAGASPAPSGSAAASPSS